MIFRKGLLTSGLILQAILFGFSQDNVGIGTTNPQAQAILELVSSNQGFLMTRMNATDTSIAGLNQQGMMFFAQDVQAFLYYDGTSWQSVASGVNYWSENGADIFNLNTGNVGVGTNSPSTTFEVHGLSAGASSGVVNVFQPGGVGASILGRSTVSGGNIGAPFAVGRIAGFENNGFGTTNYGVWGHQANAGAGGWGVIASNGASETVPDRYVGLAGSSAIPYAGVFMGGNVGIGTTTPSQFLDIQGVSGNILFNPYFPDALNQTTLMSTYLSANLEGPQQRYMRSDTRFVDVGQDSLGNFVVENEFDQAIMVGEQGGDFGIGTSDPVNKLDIEGSMAIGAAYSGTDVAPSDGMLIQGFTGIGTNTPGTQLEVRRINVGNNFGVLHVFHNSGNGNAILASGTSGGDNTGTVFSRGRLAGVSPNPTGTNNYGAWGHIEGVGAGGWGLISSWGASETTPTTYAAFSGGTYGGIIMGGNVGIGVVAPINLLDVEGSMVVGTSYSGTETAPANGMLIQGFTGIGTNSPGTQLEVRRAAAGTNGGTINAFHGSGTGNSIFASSSTGINNSGTIYAQARIAGIQTSVFGSENYGLWGHATGQGAGGWGLMASYGASETAPTRYAAFSGDAYAAVIVGGFVGIGTTIPTQVLQVVGNVYASGGDFYTSSTDGVINCGGGIMNAIANVIADATPTINVATGDEDLYIADDIELGSQGYKPGGGSWATVSDARLKRNIQPYQDGLNEILSINPVKYQYSPDLGFFDPEREHIGVLAQDIEQVAPYMVEQKDFGKQFKENGDGTETLVDPGRGTYYTFDPSALNYMLINAVKELNAKNDELQRRIEELEGK